MSATNNTMTKLEEAKETLLDRIIAGASVHESTVAYETLVNAEVQTKMADLAIKPCEKCDPLSGDTLETE